jgi:O-antigen ligase/Flp pilus assembly protein TadD
VRVRGTAIVAAAVPVVAVLAIDPGGLAPFGPAKWAAVSTTVLASAAIVWRAPARLALAPLRAWIAFLGIVAVAAVFALDRVYAWTGTPERHLGVVAWALCFVAFVAGQVLTERDARAVSVGATVAAGAVGVWAVAEACGWRPIDLVGAGARPVGTLGSSAFLGATLALLVPAAAGRCVDSYGYSTAIDAPVLGVGVVALVASGARAAWVGIAVAAALVVLARRPHIMRSRATLAAGIGGVAVLVALAFVTGVASRVPDALTERDGGARGRLDEWRVAARVVAGHPVIGTGPEGYRIAFGRAVDARYEQRHGRDPLPDRAHDALLDVAATTGLPGLVAYAVLLAGVGRFLWRALRTAPPWVAGLAAGCIAYAVQSLFLFPIAEIEPVAWVFAGIVVATQLAAEPGTRTTRPLSLAVTARAALALLAVIACTAGALDVVADRDAKRVLTAADQGRVVEDADRPARLRPDAVRYRLAAARADEARGSIAGLDLALAQLDDALDVSRRDPVARAEHARLALERARRTGNRDDVRRARDELERLRRDDPRNAQVLLRLGVARALTGDDAGAERAWLAAESLAPRSASASTDLAVLYARQHRRADAERAARRALARDPPAGAARTVLERVRGGDGT